MRICSSLNATRTQFNTSCPFPAAFRSCHGAHTKSTGPHNHIGSQWHEGGLEPTSISVTQTSTSRHSWPREMSCPTPSFYRCRNWGWKKKWACPRVTWEEPEPEDKSPGFCPKMKSQESPSTPPSRKLWGLQFHFEIMTSVKEEKKIKIWKPTRTPEWFKSPGQPVQCFPSLTILQNNPRSMEKTLWWIPWNLHCSKAPLGILTQLSVDGKQCSHPPPAFYHFRDKK